MPRTISKSCTPIWNSTLTIHCLLLIVFTSCGLLISRCGLPNKPNDNASSSVDLPAPFCPTISVVGERSN